MTRVRRILISLLAVIGLLAAIGWEGTALACPSNSVAAAPTVATDGCGHASMPAKPQLPSHQVQMCASLCFGVLPPIAQLDVHPPLAFVPLLTNLQPLSGIDPGLDPP